MGALDKKRAMLLSSQTDVESQNLGAIGTAVEKRLAAWCKDDYCKRMWAKDFTLWSAKPVPEITDRLGWLHLPETMHTHVQDLTQLREQIKKEGFTHAVLLGMGGSSLAPKVFQETFGNGKGYPELIVLDSTHPAAVMAVEKSIDLAHTLFIVSSKSGTTTEMLSFFYYFWEKVRAINKTSGTQFVAITDPGTPLEKLGHNRSFRHVCTATPDVGGRYSALTHFGLVPAAVIGVDLNRLLDRAWTMEEACTFCVPDKQNPGLQLGAVLGESTLAGRDKVTFLASKSLAAFPTWLEQLIAESTGKDDKGIVPVADEAPGAPGVYGSDRLFVYLHMDGDSDGALQKQVSALETAGHPIVRFTLSETADIGQEFFRWEVGIAAAGSVIGIQPFNQPDVQLAKDLARQAMKKTSAEGGGAPASSQGRQPVPAANAGELKHSVDAWLSTARQGDYIGLDAYLAPTAETSAALENIRTILRNRTKLATMLGYCPRFLHSTGQLHKGGPNTGLFLQILDEPAEDLAVPETDYTFATLIRAQAQGDFGALEQRGRRTLRVQLGRDVAGGLRQIAEVLRG
ncbi:MAG: bifunctional transaldolase/phosoglucose isomerase, partial [Candidatus Acidiferrales bacterium]